MAPPWVRCLTAEPEQNRLLGRSTYRVPRFIVNFSHQDLFESMALHLLRTSATSEGGGGGKESISTAFGASIGHGCDAVAGRRLLAGGHGTWVQ